MSGDRPPIPIEAAADSVLARAIQALSRFPTDQPWVLVGGIAVFIRLGSVTRTTADADTVARSQAELIDRLVADEVPRIVTGGELRIPIGAGAGARSIAEQIGRAFGQDLRYTLLRLRTNDRSAGAQALADNEAEATIVLDDELSDQAGNGPLQ